MLCVGSGIIVFFFFTSGSQWPDLLPAFSPADFQPLAKDTGMCVVVYGRTQHFGVLTAHGLCSLFFCVWHLRPGRAYHQSKGNNGNFS